MKNLLQHLIAEALDKELLVEALAAEIAERIDYEEIASNLCDAYESSIQDTVIGSAAELLDFLPF